MSTTIQIKRSTGSAAPAASDLVEGELAYAEDRSSDGASAILYISSIRIVVLHSGPTFQTLIME